MEWTPEVTATVGGVLAGIVTLMLSIVSVFYLIVRKMGARTDPEVLKLSNRQLDLYVSLETNLEKHAQVLITLAETITQHSESTAQHAAQITQALNLIVAKAQVERETITHEARIMTGTIMDKLSTLDQSELLQQIVIKLDELQASVNRLRADFMGRVEQVETELETIKGDVKQATGGLSSGTANAALPIDLPIIGIPTDKGQ